MTVLYLATDEFPRREEDLPRELLALRSERFEIRWTTNIRSYKKLIPALKDFPDDIIITFDDDLLFRPELVERLLIGYKKYPALIQCHRITNISFDEAGNVKTSHIPYDHPNYLHKLSGGAAQYVAYNFAVRDYRFRCRYMAFIDLDEFLYPRTGQSVCEVVEDILSNAPNAAALGVNWHCFGSSGHVMKFIIFC